MSIELMKMCVMEAKYELFGAELRRLRSAAGISQQSDLATKLNTSQQTVSRWEVGLSRPRRKMFPELAAILGGDVSKLLDLAGYGDGVGAALWATAVRDTPTYAAAFPVEALSPDNFERFVHHILALMHSDADVHRAGESGHVQDGIDVSVTFPDGKLFTYQCKRVQEFGPSKVHTVVADHVVKANKNFLVLSRVASPQARDAMGKHRGWVLWDKEDLSLVIRQKLTKAQQIRLVDIFFPGKRFELLGEQEAGPWQSLDDFFAPFVDRNSVFNHTWDLIGRDSEVEKIAAALMSDDLAAVQVFGPGGVGKTRLVKRAVEEAIRQKKRLSAYFLIPSQEITVRSLENLGSGEKILVVDDAHDCESLALAARYAALPANETKLVLSVRSYGLEKVRSVALSSGLRTDQISDVRVTALDIDQATLLSEQVLLASGGETELARKIAEATLNCPLATVVASKVAIESKQPIEFLGNEVAFWDTVLARFQDVIAGQIGGEIEATAVKDLLPIFALIQPFYPEEPCLETIANKVAGVSPHLLNRAVRLLTDSGLLYKRAGKLRLTPDLLADCVIERACIGLDGHSTGFAESVFDHATLSIISNVLTNVGKLDWRRSVQDGKRDELIDRIWAKVSPQSEYGDEHLNAVKEVAYYQPKKTLSLVERLIRERRFLRQLPPILVRVAYNYEHVTEACEALWQLAMDDDRRENQHPDHPRRLLSELASFAPNKPVPYSERVIEFGLSLLDRDEAWAGHADPFAILKPAFATDGQEATSNGRTITFQSYFIRLDVVSELRRKVVKAGISFLGCPNIRRAVSAASFLDDSLRPPMSLGGANVPDELRNVWHKEFEWILDQLLAFVEANEIHPIVWVELLRMLKTVLRGGSGGVKRRANKILSLVPDTTELRTYRYLIDGFGYSLERVNETYEQIQKRLEIELGKVADELIGEIGNGEELRAHMAACMRRVEEAAPKDYYHDALYRGLIERSESLRDATIKNAVENPESPTACHLGVALFSLVRDNWECGMRQLEEILESRDSQNLHQSVCIAARAINFNQPEKAVREEALVRRLLQSEFPSVVANSVMGVKWAFEAQPERCVGLLVDSSFHDSNSVADAVLSSFFGSRSSSLDTLEADEVQSFLNKMVHIPELDGHWIESFLAEASYRFPRQTLDFFFARIDFGLQQEDLLRFRPCNHGPYVHVALRFRETDVFDELLHEMLNWMKLGDSEDYWFRHFAVELFESAFAPYDSQVLNAVLSTLHPGDPVSQKLLSQILRSANPRFVFQQKEFVIRLLEQTTDGEQREDLASALYGASIGGMRSGVPGEPFPQDVEMQQSAKGVMESLSRFSNAYGLYESLENYAAREIARAIKEGERYED